MQDQQVRFGYFLIPAASEPLIETAQRVEQLGLDYVAIQDHPYQRNFAETWSLMAMIAASTTTLGVFPDVANLPLRPPAVMAKTAATIDLLSGGRFDLGLGAGAFWDGIEAYGGPRRSGRESLDALEEAITRSGVANATFASPVITTASPARKPGRCRRTTSGFGSAHTDRARWNSRDASLMVGYRRFAGTSTSSPR